MSSAAHLSTNLFATFYVGDRFYGIDVMKVQEITKAMPMSGVPLSPKYVHGLINLRGQIATAIGLRDLFSLKSESPSEHMNIICASNELLISFLVDRIGDVLAVSEADFEKPSDTIPSEIRRFMSGVYKLPDRLLSIIDVEAILKVINN
jgi:purine-binding chemotaxis protein CheW